jgi:hypothetical protein
MVIIAGLYLTALEWLDAGATCVIKNVAGIPCPSCGMTRSYLHVLEGDFQSAFYDHPLFLTVPFILIIAYVLSVKHDDKRLTRILTIILIIIIAVFIIVYIYRMIHYFPHTEPLKFNDRGVIPTIIRNLRLVFD